MVCAVGALIWANSPWAQSYFDLWHIEAGFSVGTFHLEMHLGHWINDGLMAIFFFLVGLEIKREILVGELATVRRAALPLAAATGGVVLPALIYVAMNAGKPGIAGWGIPMATDIAFALGILALLGSRVPIGLKVFLTALAIADDIMAVLVIAIFYTENLQLDYLAIGGVILVALFGFARIKLRSMAPYFLLGAILWYCFYQSGIHATIAGILLAFTIPARPRIGSRDFAEVGRDLMDTITGKDDEPDDDIDRQQMVVSQLGARIEQVDTPLHRIERVLHPWVAFLVIPIFAFANAGVSFSGSSNGFVTPVAMGIALGLIVGKFGGIVSFSILAVKMNWASLPRGVSWAHIRGAAILGGVGFTMSLFIGGLAFEGDAGLLSDAKIGILTGSLVAGVIGLFYLRSVFKKDHKDDVVKP
jgi:NhaA family Na+:H+ antiporter